MLGFEEENYYKANPHIRPSNPQWDPIYGGRFGYDAAYKAEQERMNKEALEEMYASGE